MENFIKKEELIKESIREITSLDFMGNQDKVDIILTYKQFKPAGKIELFFKPGYKSYSEQDFETNIEKVEKIFKDLSLPYELEISKEKDFHIAVFYIGKDSECRDRIKRAFSEKDNDRKDLIVGKELGYPSTAIEGYRNRKIKKFNSLPEEVRNSEYIKFLNFQLSEDHWEEEFETVKERADELQKISPDLYQKIVAVDKK